MYRRPIYPSMSNNYGDPTIVPDSTGTGIMVGTTNYQTTTVLMTLYSFDWSKATSKDADACPAKISGCLYQTIKPTFPQEPTSGDDLVAWEKTWIAKVDATKNGVKHHLTDSSGVMFYKGDALYEILDASQGVITFQSRPTPGKYQVTVQVAARSGHPSVPVDFIVDIVDSIYENAQIAYTLNDKTLFPFNDYIPTIRFEAPVKAVAGDSSMVEFVGRHQLPDAPPQAEALDGTCERTGTCWQFFDGFTYPKKARAFAGFGVEVKVVGQDMQGVISLALSTIPDDLDHKDSKVGFSIGPAPDSVRFTSVKDTNPSEMMISWTPCSAELGATILCMDAVDYHITRSATLDPTQDVVGRSASSNMRCFNIEVVKDPSPQFTAGLPTEMTLIMGREGKIELRAWDENCLDSVTIGLAAGSELPVGAVFDPQLKGSGFGRSCTSMTRTMRWTPSIKMGGFEGQTCFTVRDTGGSPTCGAEAVAHTSTHCVKLYVTRCKYALQMDQQLQEISALFDLDWMRLWSLNLDITHPDYVVYNEQVVSVGHLYRVAPNERMDQISQRLGMSMQQLRDLNFDIDGNNIVKTGQTLCVVPNSCRGQRETFYTGMVYKDEKFLASANTGPK